MEKQDKGFAHILIIIIILALGIVAGVYLVQHPQIFKPKASFSGVSISLMPTQNNVSSNQSLTLDVFMDTHDFKVSAIELHIGFDPSKITITSLKPSEKLPVVLQQEQIKNEEVSLILGSNPENTFSGTGSIATLELQTKENFDNSSISLLQETLVSALDNTDSITGNLESATLTLVASSSATPTPTASPTSEPTPTPTASPTPTPTAVATASPSPSSTHTSNQTFQQTASILTTANSTPTPIPTPVASQPQNTQNLPNAIKKPTNNIIAQTTTPIIERTAPPITQSNPSPQPSPKTDDTLEEINNIPIVGRVFGFLVQLNIDIIKFFSR